MHCKGNIDSQNPVYQNNPRFHYQKIQKQNHNTYSLHENLAAKTIFKEFWLGMQQRSQNQKILLWGLLTQFQDPKLDFNEYHSVRPMHKPYSQTQITNNFEYRYGRYGRVEGNLFNKFGIFPAAKIKISIKWLNNNVRQKILFFWV